MKVYLIYALPSVIRPGSEDGDRKELYGITNKKKLLKKFMKIRNKDLFQIVIEDMEDEEYRALCNNNRDCVLQKAIFDSLINDPYPETLNRSFSQALEKYTVVVTFLELQSVEEARESFISQLEIEFVPPYILSSKIMNALKKLYYHTLFRINNSATGTSFYLDNNVLPDYTAKKSFEMYDDDYDLPDIYVDELSIFLTIYGHMLK